MKTVQVVFSRNGHFEGTSYSYAVPDHLEVGEYAVVDSPQQGLVVVKVIGQREDAKATKRILSFFGLEEERKLRQKDQEKYEAKMILEKKLKEFNELHAYRLMAEMDSEAAQLLKILEGK